MTTRGVLLDLDETLLDRRATLLRYADDLYFELKDSAKLDFEAFVSLLEELDGLGRTSRDIFFNGLATHGFTNISNADLREHFYTNAWLQPAIFPGVIEFLKALREHGIPTGIVTNGGSDIQRAKIRNSGIVNYVDSFVISEDFGSRKPDPEIFHHAVKELATDPANSWFIGDDPVSDIIGASKAGFKTLCLERYLEWPVDQPYCFDLRASSFGEVKVDIFIP